MAYRPNPDDLRLVVEFYTQDKNGKTVEMVKVSDPNDPLLVRCFRALDVSHRDENEDRNVTYAERFAPQYAAFKRGETKTATSKIEKLQAQITTEQQKIAGAGIDMDGADKAADDAAKAREKLEAEADAEAEAQRNAALAAGIAAKK